MRIIKRNQPVTITGADPDLLGTPLAGMNFSITVKPMNRTEQTRIRATVPGKGRFNRPDEAAVQTAICLDAIQDWEGIENEDGEPLPRGEEGKRFLLEECPELAAVIWMRITESQVAKDEAEAEEVKNSRSSIGGN